MGTKVETRERVKQPSRKTCAYAFINSRNAQTRNLLNLHWLFCLRISAKSWTTYCRDRIAPDFPIRHPVRPIVALQRRMRFSSRLAGFCRDRCHQRRARRAERASFSVLVSNPDFRVPRLRQIGWRAADRAVRRRKRGHPRGPESRPGLLRRIRLARSGPGAAQASLMPIFPQAWIQVFALGAWHPAVSGKPGAVQLSILRSMDRKACRPDP